MTMTALEKFPVLQDRDVLLNLLAQSVHGNMELEEQAVPMEAILHFLPNLLDEALEATAVLELC